MVAQLDCVRGLHQYVPLSGKSQVLGLSLWTRLCDHSFIHVPSYNNTVRCLLTCHGCCSHLERPRPDASNVCSHARALPRCAPSQRLCCYPQPRPQRRKLLRPSCAAVAGQPSPALSNSCELQAPLCASHACSPSASAAHSGPQASCCYRQPAVPHAVGCRGRSGTRQVAHAWPAGDPAGGPQRASRDSGAQPPGTLATRAPAIAGSTADWPGGDGGLRHDSVHAPCAGTTGAEAPAAETQLPRKSGSELHTTVAAARTHTRCATLHGTLQFLSGLVQARYPRVTLRCHTLSNTTPNR